MKLKQALVEMKENLERYTYESTTETRQKTGAVMTQQEVERRKKSIPKLEERLAIINRWARQKYSPFASMTQFEEEIIAMYDLDLDEIIARPAFE